MENVYARAVSSPSVFVTGSLGNVGREVVRALLARGVQVRAGDRDPARVEALFGSAVDAARFDFRDRATFASMKSCSGLFLLRPPAIADVKTTLLPLVDEARRLGVAHIVFLSVAGAQTNRLVPHHAVEKHLARDTDPGRGWTVLRPGFFAQNLGDAYLRDIVEDDRIYVPAGRGRAAFVDVRDVAEVAALAFASPQEHDRRGYTLTGHEAVAFAEVASLLTEVLGRPIRYEAASIAGYLRHLRRRNLSWTQAAVQAVLHVGLRFGQAERIDPTLERLLGRSSRSLRTYIEDHRALWGRSSETR